MDTLSDTISDYVINRLKAIPALAGVSIIRNADESSERGESVIIVDTQDKGNHLGIPGRMLVDAAVALALCVHVTDDQGGERTSALREAVEGLIYDQSAMTPADPIGEWYIRYWEPSGSGIEMDGNYRKATYQAKLILQNIKA